MDPESEPLAILSPRDNSEVSMSSEVKSSLEAVQTWREEDEKFRSEDIPEWTVCPKCVLIRKSYFVSLCINYFCLFG